MKRIVTLILLLTITIQITANKIITISTGEYVPFSGSNIKHNGFVLHVIREAFELEGYSVKYDFLPWARAYKDMVDGYYTASAYWVNKVNRKKEALYSDEVILQETVLFHKKNKRVKWDKLEDLKEYRIGATVGYNYSDEFWDLEAEGVLSIESGGTDLINFRKLIFDRIDVFPCNLATGKYLLNNNFPSDLTNSITFSRKTLTQKPGYLLFSKSQKDSEKYLEIFNRGLARLKQSGKYDEYFSDLLLGKYDE